MKANIFQVINNTKKNLYLLPNDIEDQKRWGYFIPKKSFLIIDRIYDKYGLIDFDEYHFIFEGGKRKIKAENLHKYDVHLFVLN